MCLFKIFHVFQGYLYQSFPHSCWFWWHICEHWIRFTAKGEFKVFPKVLQVLDKKKFQFKLSSHSSKEVCLQVDVSLLFVCGFCMIHMLKMYQCFIICKMLLLKKLHDNVSVTKIYLMYNFFLLDQCQLTGTLIQLTQGHTSTYENSWKNPNLQERLLFLFPHGYDILLLMLKQLHYHYYLWVFDLHWIELWCMSC